MNNMKKTAIVAIVLAVLLLIQQVVFMTPLYDSIYAYFAHHSLRYLVYRSFWVMVKLLLILMLGTVLYTQRRRLPKLHTGHKWLTLLMAVAYTVPVIWSLVDQRYYQNGIGMCYTNNYYHIFLLLLLIVWLACLVRTHYEHFSSEVLGIVGVLAAYSAVMLMILGVHSFVLFWRYRYAGGWNTEAMISWLVPVFPALSAWIYWIENVRRK